MVTIRTNGGRSFCVVAADAAGLKGEGMIVWNDKGPADWLALVTVLAGFIYIAFQYRASLLLQQQNAREELKLRVYENLNKAARKLAHTNSTACIYALVMPGQLEGMLRQDQAGFAPLVTGKRGRELIRLEEDAGVALVDLMVEIEAWEIAFPPAELFRTALSVAARDIQNAHHALLPAAIQLLPMERDDGTLFPLPALTAERINALKMLVASYCNARDDLGGYVHDLRIEAQNALLSGLFARKLPPRKPLDPRCKVLTNERATELIQHFMTQTNYGRDAAEAQEAVRREITEREGPQP